MLNLCDSCVKRQATTFIGRDTVNLLFMPINKGCVRSKSIALCDECCDKLGFGEYMSEKKLENIYENNFNAA